MALRGENKAAARALKILSFFASENPSYSTSALSKELGLTKNSVFRCLETLVHQGYLVRDATGTRYELGPGVMQLRSPRWETPEIRAIARPFLDRLSEMTGETVHLLAHSGSHAIVVESIEGWSNRFRLPIGTTIPLHISPGSRSILAFLTELEIDQYVASHQPLERFTKGTLTDPARLMEDLRRIRAQGYALSHEDFRIGRVGIAFPILDLDSRPHGSVVIAGARERTTEQNILAQLPHFKAVMAELNQLSRLYRAQSYTGAFDS
jgi:IclR family transcriptional regulator, KDG regulon repressor